MGGKNDKRKKVVISIILICFMVSGLLVPQKSYAASDRDFLIYNGVLTKYQGSGGDVVIPTSVTEIGDSAFSCCSSLTSVTIPNSVGKIGVRAFEGCYSLSRVVIPNSVSEISDGAFWECRSLTEVTIPNSVTSIGSIAFENCSSLTTITIPDSVSEIGNGAFSDTPWLEKKRTERKDHLVIMNNILIDGVKAQGELAIPDHVTTIANGAFENCTSLTSVTLPDSVTEIGARAFENCSSLTNVRIPVGVTAIQDRSFSLCRSLVRIAIPDSVTKIGIGAFEECRSLASAVIPDRVREIGDDAFGGCKNLITIKIPNSVTTIGAMAFESCSKLKEFTIPKNVKKLGSSILSDCDSLKKITILNKTVNLIDTFALNKNKKKENCLITLLGYTWYGDGHIEAKKPAKALTIYGYKYSTADEFAVRLNTLQGTKKVFGIKSVKFVALDKSKNILDKIKVPKSMTIKKGKSKKLSIQLPSSLKRVDKFTKKQGQVKISIIYSKENNDFFKEGNDFVYDIKKVSNDTIKSNKKGTFYIYTTAKLPNGDKKVFATKVIVK